MIKFFKVAGKALFILNISFSLHAMNECDENPTQQLIKAISKKNSADVQRCIDNGADVNFINEKKDYTPLIQAVCKNSNDIAQLLINAGADVDLFDKNERTPIAWAAAMGYEELICTLLAAYADANKKDANGHTPLILASQRSRANNASLCILQHLLKSGVEIDVQDKNGNTALYHAVAYGYKDGIETLLAVHANPILPNNKGESPLDAYLKRASDDISIPSLLVERLLRMPSEEQRKKIVTFLWCLQKKNVSKDLIQGMRPFVLDVIYKENWGNVNSRAYQEICKIKADELRGILLTKYEFPLFEEQKEELDEDSLSCCVLC